MEKHKVIINQEKCIGCGLCNKVCVAKNIKQEDKKAKIVLENCIMCGHCTAVCPQKAIKISGYTKAPIEKNEEISLDPKKVLEVIRFRRTVRQFKNQEIPKNVINDILEVGRLTHTAKNMQDVSFIVLDKKKDEVEKMAVNVFKKIKPIAGLFSKMAKRNQISDNFFFFKAPTVIVILAKNKENGILAAQNMEFVAEANGLGVLYSGFFTVAANISPKIKKTLKIPKGKKVAMTLVLGYPKVKFLTDVPRKTLEVTYL